MLYRVKIDYDGGTPFKALLNNHIFADVNGWSSGSVRLPDASLFLGKDKSVVSILWGEEQEEAAWTIDGGKRPPWVRLEVLRQKDDLAESEVVLKREFKPEEHKSEDGSSYLAEFAHEDARDFSAILYEVPICNASPEDWAENRAKMLKLAISAYNKMVNEDPGGIVSKSKRKLSDSALVYRHANGEEKSRYAEMLKGAARRLTPQYSLRNEDQIVFLPSCGGRLWRAVVMHDPVRGRDLTARTCFLPHALPDYNFELISMAAGIMRVSIPSYLANVDGSFEIVR